MGKILVLFLIIAVASCYEENTENIENDLELEEIFTPQALRRLRRQVFGGYSSFPGGFNKEIGYRTPTNPVSGWGSLTQSGNDRGITGPIGYNLGGDLRSPSGSGLSLSANHFPNLGTQATAAGNLNLFKTPSTQNTHKHEVNAFASHTKQFDPNFQEIGRGSTTAGAGYKFTSKDDLTSVNIGGQRTFREGLKPDDQFTISVDHKF